MARNSGLVSDPGMRSRQDVLTSSDDENTPYSSGSELPIAPKSEKVLEADNEVPDGGLRAWLVVLGAWCGLFCTLGWLNSTYPETPHDYQEA